MPQPSPQPQVHPGAWPVPPGVAPTTLMSSDRVGAGAGLILSGNTLYGTAYRGGSSGNGTVFAVNTDGAGLAAGLILSGNTLYRI